jgi:two-component system response regulator LytT
LFLFFNFPGVEYTNVDSALVRQAKVLVVEDEFLIAEDIREMLEMFGCKRVVLAENLDEALAFLAQTEFDLVLLDINLNAERLGTELGLFLYKELRIPFIYITAYADVKTINEVKDTYPSGYLLKPFSEKMLFALIQIALQKRSEQERELIEGDEVVEQAEKLVGYFHIKQNGVVHRIAIEEIICFVADRMYVEVQTKLRRFVIRNSLSQLSIQLDGYHFVKCHKKYLVNLDLVESYNSKFLFIKELQIPISRRMKEHVLLKLKHE